MHMQVKLYNVAISFCYTTYLDKYISVFDFVTVPIYVTGLDGLLHCLFNNNRWTTLLFNFVTIQN